MNKKHDVFGIGNPLMDVMVEVQDQHLTEMELKKGVMHLIDEKKAHSVLDKHVHTKIVPAGATTNTLMGIVALGGKAILIGKVGKGKFGDMYEEIITQEGVTSKLFRCEKSRTGKVLNFVTPDAERTFGVTLGAAVNLEKDNIVEADIKNSRFLYLTGYEFESLNGAVMHALEVAKSSGIQVALDLADPELIKRNLPELKKLVADYVNILFMNEREAEVFTGKMPEEAVREVGAVVDIAIVKVGSDGSLIMSGRNFYKVPSYKVDAIDTTGAGDLFAAGFLYSIIKGKSIEQAAKVGAYMGSRIIVQMGALMPKRMKADVKNMFDLT